MKKIVMLLVAGILCAGSVVGQTWQRIGGGSGLGDGQNWYDVTSLRSFNTVYTNNTSKPIYVVIGVLTATASWGISVNGVGTGNSGGGGGGVLRNTQSVIVPSGATYQTVGCYGTCSLQIWSELR